MHILRHRRLLVLIERTWSGGPLSIDQLCRSALGHPAVNIPRWLGSILLLDSMPVRIDTFQPALSYRSRGDIYKVVTVLCIIPASTFAEVATSCKYSHSYAWQMLNFPSHISKFIHVGPFYSIYNRSQLHLFNLSRTRILVDCYRPPFICISSQAFTMQGPHTANGRSTRWSLYILVASLADFSPIWRRCLYVAKCRDFQRGSWRCHFAVPSCCCSID